MKTFAPPSNDPNACSSWLSVDTFGPNHDSLLGERPSERHDIGRSTELAGRASRDSTSHPAVPVQGLRGSRRDIPGMRVLEVPDTCPRCRSRVPATLNLLRSTGDYAVARLRPNSVANVTRYMA